MQEEEGVTMKKEDMTWGAMLAEAVCLVSALIYMGLQICYGISYGAKTVNVVLNILMIVLIYAGLTMLCIYPEWVNGLRKDACTGDIRRYTLRMVRTEKSAVVLGVLFASIFDVAGRVLSGWYAVAVVGFMIVTAIYYEHKIIKILRELYKK